MDLPPEIWLYIHRLATSDASPLDAARSEEYLVPKDPVEFKDSQYLLRNFLRDARSFALVSKFWNSLSNEILYENVRVDDRFHTLYTSLERPGTASLVRSIRLSTSRFDHNFAIIMLCSRVQVICLPDLGKSDQRLALLTHKLEDVATNLLQLPFLRHVYWTDSFLASRLLRVILRAAPNLDHLLIAPSVIIPKVADPEGDLLPLPTLRRLAVPKFEPNSAVLGIIFKLDLQRLRRLDCRPVHLSHPDLPTLPVLETLEIVGLRQVIPFAAIFVRCPRLRELRYNVAHPLRDLAPRPPAPRPPFACVRLESTSLTTWISIEAHFAMFLSTEFPTIERLVLYGPNWHPFVSDARFTHFHDGLRARGCQLEYPEGFDQ
ncbi:hypothetical protein B0H11DRAFT_1333448 [Mycena galericulata]|nr:hypothetical protein B0H11DRAFT_1333448 [Mycena galericulata]